MKKKLNKYAIVRFVDDDTDDNTQNWLLVRYNSLKNRKLFASENASTDKQYCFDSKAKIIYRTDLNKKTVIFRKNTNGRPIARFRINRSSADYFILYFDLEDDDMKFKMESDAAAILYAMSLE